MKASDETACMLLKLLSEAENGPTKHSLEGLPLVAAWPATAEGAIQREVDVLLAVYAHHEGWHVHDLLSDPAPQCPLSPRTRTPASATAPSHPTQ